MTTKTFRGGVHPPQGKTLTSRKPIQTLEVGGEFVFPLSQHVGAPATPLVKVGDRVLVGQKIGEKSGFISAHIHSSVSGKVTAVEPRLLPNGSFCLSIVVQNDELYEPVETQNLPADTLALIEEMGVVGLGGAGFPTAVKLQPKDPSAITHVLVNAAECEPYITTDHRLMLEEPDAIKTALQTVLSLFENARAFIGIEDNKPDAIATMQTIADDRITVVPLKTKYPQGGERVLIRALTGKVVRPGQLPAAVGCIVINVSTLYAIYNATVRHTPLIQTVVTVSGDAVKEPQNFLVRVGAPLSALVEAAGGLVGDPEKLIFGGPMMGFALPHLSLPTVRTTSAVLAFAHDDVPAPTPCINCGRCAKVCPENLLPMLLARAADEPENFQDLGGMGCVDCGACAYVCPAKRPLVQRLREGKRYVSQRRAEK